jgi:2,4-dienoyl-CoA reductase-like NADH-dependent reductase (Old Yellow Enzyme family)
MFSKNPRDPSCRAESSTIAREAYFLSYSESIRAVTGSMTLAVTGGFRSRQGMEAALSRLALDIIGIARPMCVQTDAVRHLLSSENAQLSSFENEIQPINTQMAWFCMQLRRLGEGKEPNLRLEGHEAAVQHVALEDAAAARLAFRSTALVGT